MDGAVCWCCGLCLCLSASASKATPAQHWLLDLSSCLLTHDFGFLMWVFMCGEGRCIGGWGVEGRALRDSCLRQFPLPFLSENKTFFFFLGVFVTSAESFLFDMFEVTDKLVTSRNVVMFRLTQSPSLHELR